MLTPPSTGGLEAHCTAKQRWSLQRMDFFAAGVQQRNEESVSLLRTEVLLRGECENDLGERSWRRRSRGRGGTPGGMRRGGESPPAARLICASIG